MKISTHALLLDSLKMFEGEKTMTPARAAKLNSYRTILLQNNANGCRAMVAVSRVVLIMRLREFGSYMDTYFGRSVSEETSARLATLVPEYRVLHDRTHFLLRSVLKNWNECHSVLLPFSLTAQIQELRLRVSELIDAARRDRFVLHIVSLKQQVSELPPIPCVKSQEAPVLPKEPNTETLSVQAPVSSETSEPTVIKPLFSGDPDWSNPLENLKKIQAEERK